MKLWKHGEGSEVMTSRITGRNLKTKSDSGFLKFDNLLIRLCCVFYMLDNVLCYFFTDGMSVELLMRTNRERERVGGWKNIR